MDKLTKAERKEMRKQERHEWEAKLEKEQKTGKYKKFGIWTLAAIATGLSLWGLVTLVNTPSAPAKLDIKQPPLQKNDIITGPKDAKITLVEYADFQCPTCALYHPIVSQLLDEYAGKIRFAYGFFPLPTIHPNANAAAQAAYAAHKQGKFREMESMLFEKQKDWSKSLDAEKVFTEYAKKLELDTEKFKKDYHADETKKFIEDQVNAGSQAGIAGTPTFFLNGKHIENPRGYEAFKELIGQALKGKG